MKARGLAGETAAPIGRIFSLQRFCLHDGPGIRTTVFLHGCPLSCFWCHNPESRAAADTIWVRRGRCLDCGTCVGECPTGAAGGGASSMRVDPVLCAACGHCIEVCPAGARSLLQRETGVDDLMAEVSRDEEFFRHSGGGVTFSGGEPLLQPAFLAACLRACREQGIHTAVDTCAWASIDLLCEAAAAADLMLVDLKVMDDRRHLEATGVPAEPILANIRALDAGTTEVWLRMPLVPGFNDAPADLEAAGRFVTGLTRIRRLHLLPCHRLGDAKREALGDSSGPAGIPLAATEAAEAAAKVLRDFDLDIRVGGRG